MAGGRHYIISGRVQGVFFRSSTQKEATSLSLTGWVRNLPSGQVEVKVFGDEAQLQKLEAWLQHGPRGAKVAQVKGEVWAWEDYEDFQVRHDASS